MTVEELLPQLQAVRRTARGYLGRCPSHDDRTPSLSITEGDRGLLLRCWAGCRIEEICASLSLSVKDLFFDAPTDPWEAAKQKAQRERQRGERERRRDAANMTLDACKAAQRFIESRHGLDISQWSNEQLDAELNALANAHVLLGSEGL